MKAFLFLFLVVVGMASFQSPKEVSWIRINLLGYQPASSKVAVWCSKGAATAKTFLLFDVASNKIVYTGATGKAYGAYGPFAETQRLNFSAFKTPGTYKLKVGETESLIFRIGSDVYKGTADFCLRYMRQQRCGFNPYLKDSCHNRGVYTLYGEETGIKDSTHLDIWGGWHDASDYLQYSATSANATYHLLAAYRDFSSVFGDEKGANGLEGKNGLADVLDEAKWGLDWLLRMHPRPDWMFNQLADDRDHMGMRMPGLDTFYGRGFERPVYFISGEPQQRGKFMNTTTGTSSTAAKMASAFALGSSLFQNQLEFSEMLGYRVLSAIRFALKKRGVTQTASVRSPYIYAEANWTDDLELAFAVWQSVGSEEEKVIDDEIVITDVDEQSPKRNKATSKKNAEAKRPALDTALAYAAREPITPWLGADTAAHYQWYPFINLGHYEVAKQLKGARQNTITGYYKTGINRVWAKAKQNAFYRGVPFIWCSNNLTTSFAMQCLWYRELTGDKSFEELEQANFDWLFGCNPWGTSMVYGLPAAGDTPTDPHSAFTHIKQYPIDGGLVDGPVYGIIYKNLIGITLYEPDEYAAFQSDLVVYHDDYGDYSTNEPTMDGTASLIYLLAARENQVRLQNSKGKSFR